MRNTHGVIFSLNFSFIDIAHVLPTGASTMKTIELNCKFDLCETKLVMFGDNPICEFDAHESVNFY